MFGYVIGGWMMSKEGENVFDLNLFYCFVMYAAKETKEEKFRFFVLPSKVVAAYLRNEHQYFRRAKRKKGEKTPIRIFRLGFKGEKYAVPTPLVEEYENRWRLVGAAKNGA